MLKILSLTICFLAVFTVMIALQNSVSAQGIGNCDSSYVVKTEKDPHVISDMSQKWIKAIIKAGSQNQGDACFSFTENITDGCYTVEGLGTATASAVKVGGGPACKDISHVEWFAEQRPTPEPSIDPSPSASPSATPSPTVTVSSEPTPTPEPSPSSIPSLSLTPSVTTESVEKQQERMIEEVKQENGGQLPSMGFK